MGKGLVTRESRGLRSEELVGEVGGDDKGEAVKRAGQPLSVVSHELFFGEAIWGESGEVGGEVLGRRDRRCEEI